MIVCLKLQYYKSAILASKVNAPSVYDISNMSDNFKIELKQTLKKMKQQEYISDSQYQEALSQLNNY